MQIDVNSFIAQLAEPNEIESRFYTPKMTADQVDIFNRFKDAELPYTIMGRRILGHCYGSVLALKLKRWIFANYPIGNATGSYDAFTDSTKMLPA